MGQQRAAAPKPTPPGPLARKIVSALQQLQRQKVIDLSAWRAGHQQAEAVAKTLTSAPELAHLDPLHALYVYAQNQLAVMIDQLAELPPLAKLTNAYVAAEEDYMPSGPPMSPLTKSHFTNWGAFDLVAGVKRESFATIAIAVCRQLRVAPALIEVLETMQQSRLGIYRHEGSSGRYLQLSELVTHQRINAISPSGYTGRAGELWLTRILPPAPRFGHSDYAVVFATPYVLGELDDHGRYRAVAPSDWLAYIGRTSAQLNVQEPVAAYERLMKVGLSRHHWNEYVFLAYVNHREDCVYLAGFPDLPASLPHSKAGQARWDD